MKVSKLSSLLIASAIGLIASSGSAFSQWLLTGNTIAAGDWLGTVNNLPLEMRVFGTQRLLIDINNNTDLTGDLTLPLGNLNLTSGSISVASGGVAVNGGAISVNGGGLHVLGGGAHINGGNLHVNSNNVHVNNGNVDVHNGNIGVHGGGGIDIHVGGPFTMHGGTATIHGGGNFDMHGGGSFAMHGGGSFDLHGGGPLTVHGGPLNLNGGMLNVAGGPVIVGGGPVTVAGGTLTMAGGPIAMAGNGIQNATFVGIGVNTPLNLLDVAGSAVFGTAYAAAVTAPPNSVLIENELGVGYTANPGTYVAYFNGNVWSSGSYLSSDERFKENIATIPGAIDKVMQLRGVSYDYRQGVNNMRFPETHQIGFIAQEVEKVIPEVVITNNDGYKGVAYGQVTAVLVEAIKEQQAEITSLQEKIARLEMMVNKLTGNVEQSTKAPAVRIESSDAKPTVK